ncbi:MAG: hypothetical protein AAB621_03570 [Patescibacteria group bacterium]
MKGILATLMCFLLFSQAFGHEADNQKHPEQEWNFLFTDVSNVDNTYRGFSFMKSNYAKTQFLGLSFSGVNKPKVKKSSGAFSFTREIDTEINGYIFKDTVQIEGREETVKKETSYTFGLDLRFLPNKLRSRKKTELFKNIEGGIFWGGGAEINLSIVTQKTTLYFRQGNDGLNTVNIPTFPTSTYVEWGPYLVFGVFGNMNRLTAFIGAKKVYCPKNNKISLASNIGIKF